MTGALFQGSFTYSEYNCVNQLTKLLRSTGPQKSDPQTDFWLFHLDAFC